MLPRLRAAASALLLAGIQAAQAQPPPGCADLRYAIDPLPFQPAAVNAARQVVGKTLKKPRAILRDGSEIVTIPLPAGFDSAEATAINAAGHVVGIAYNHAANTHRAFFYIKGSLTLLPGDQTRALYISDADTIAGEAVMPGNPATVPTIWEHGALKTLGACCAGTAKGVDANGSATGDAYDSGGKYHAFLWTPGAGLQQIGPADKYNSAMAINARSHVVIQAFSDVLLYADGRLLPLEPGVKEPVHPRAINDADDIVGAVGRFSDVYRAFVWNKTGPLQDLNTRIPPDSGWKLETATGISNRCDIVGSGDLNDDEDVGYVLRALPAAQH